VAPDGYILHVRREDGERLVLDGLALARSFFIADPSATLGGYDSLTGLGDPNRVVLEDVVAMNTTMRSRSKHSLWDAVLASDQRWLSAIPSDLDLIEADEDEWKAVNGDALLAGAIGACIRPGIGQQLVSAIRREGRRNLMALRRIQAELAKSEITRSLIRIFDAILWFSHPAASVTGAKRSIEVGLEA
jgi:hypothetical protein